MKDRIRYAVAVAVGVLAIPGLALASNAALSQNDEPSAATVTTVAESQALDANDLVRACGAEGRWLADLEAAGTINQVQQAALNALRPICEDASLLLPVAPGPEAVVETIIVGPQASTAVETQSSPTTSVPGGDYEDALAAREQALAAIQTATDAGGNVDKLNSAINLLSQGDAAYEAGDFAAAEALYEDSADMARAAEMDPEPSTYHDDDEDDEDEDDEDDEDEDDHDEDEDEQDEDEHEEDDDDEDDD